MAESPTSVRRKGIKIREVGVLLHRLLQSFIAVGIGPGSANEGWVDACVGRGWAGLDRGEGMNSLGQITSMNYILIDILSVSGTVGSFQKQAMAPISIVTKPHLQ